MTWRVSVDSGRCIGSGLCVGSVPEAFRFDDQQRSIPAADLIEPDEAVRDAAVSCPVEAITLVDAETGDPVAQ